MARALRGRGTGNPDGATVTPGGRGRSALAPPSSSPAAAAGSEKKQTALGRRPAGRPRPRPPPPISARLGGEQSFPGPSPPRGGRRAGVKLRGERPRTPPRLLRRVLGIRPLRVPSPRPVPRAPRSPGCARQPAGQTSVPRATAPQTPAGPRHRAASPLGSPIPDPRPLSQTGRARPGRVTAQAANPTGRGAASPAELFLQRCGFSSARRGSPQPHVSPAVSGCPVHVAKARFRRHLESVVFKKWPASTTPGFGFEHCTVREALGCCMLVLFCITYRVRGPGVHKQVERC